MNHECPNNNVNNHREQRSLLQSKQPSAVNLPAPVSGSQSQSSMHPSRLGFRVIGAAVHTTAFWQGEPRRET